MMDRLFNAYRKADLTPRDLVPPEAGKIELGSVMGWAVLVFFLAFAAWSVVAPLDEGVAVEGSVTSLGNRKMVQHPIGGVVSKIWVTEGQAVKEGELLVQLNPLNSDANLASAQLQLINLLASESRLRSERQDLPAIQWLAVLEKMGKDPRVLEAKSVQLKLFEARKAEYVTSLRTKKEQLELLKADAQNALKLAAEGLMPRLDANNMAREALRNESELSQLVNARLSKIDQELSDILGLKDAVQAKVQSLSFDRGQFDIRSPVTGVVSGLRVNTLGGVVTPAQTLMEVVPGSNDLVIEARVPTYLIGKIKHGMQANLRFVAFVQRNTPVLQGEVILVGADKVASDKIGDPSHSADANRAEYYLVRIAIKDDLAEKLPGKTLQPGMPVDVVFKGGERSFLTYLFKPLTDQLAKSFLN
ncbi:MAG: Type secretion system rane fusion protein PrsE [Pseudomonadota bacterium]